MSEWMETQGAPDLAREAIMGAGIGKAAGKIPLCAVRECSDEGRFAFNGQRACSRRHLELLLRAAVLQEQTRAMRAALRVKSRVLMGRILIEQGAITEPQLEQALASQRSTGAGKLGSWLKQQVELPEADFTAALSIQWRCPVFRLGNFAPARMASFLPRPLMEKLDAVPLRLSGSPQRLSLCFEDHVNYELLSAAERMHGVATDAGLLTATEFWQATRELLGVRFPRAVCVEASSPDCMVESMSRLLVKANAEDARMVAVGDCYWLRLWPAAGAMPCDLLCTPRGSSLNGEAGAASVEQLTASMLSVLG